MANVIADIQAKIKEYNIAPEDLGIGVKKKPGKMVRKLIAPKYCDTTNGATWSGRGKPPKWMSGRDKFQFLIKNLSVNKG